MSIHYLSQQVSEDALKIKAAFNLTDIIYYGAQNNVLSTYLVGFSESPTYRLKITWAVKLIPKRAEETYFQIEFTEFPLEGEEGPDILSSISFPIYSRSHTPSSVLQNIILKALYCLGIDISSVEKSWNLSVTSHDKLEWNLDFQESFRREFD